jgi:hypothetical protein
MTELSKREFLILRCQEIQKEINELMAQATKATFLEAKIRDIQAYEKSVQSMIAIHPDLADEWKNFEKVYLNITGRELLRTADEKIFNRRENKCIGCGKVFR